MTRRNSASGRTPGKSTVQQPAGYNQHPGRPIHVLQTSWIGHLPPVLDAQVSPGKQHTSGQAKAVLSPLLALCFS